MYPRVQRKLPQVLALLSTPISIGIPVMVFNDVMCKSHKQRLITKEHIATHTNLILAFTWLYTPVFTFKKLL